MRSEVKSTAAPKVESGTARPNAGAEEDEEDEEDDDEEEIEETEAGLEDIRGIEGEEGLIGTGAGDNAGCMVTGEG